METRVVKPYLTVILLMVVTSLALAYTVDVTVTDEAGIRVELPDVVGEWRGEEIRYCQHGACQRVFNVSNLAHRDACPSCGGSLDSMSKAEKDQLPEDTVLLKKRYFNPVGETIFASIVMSGRERASIHRPQICLVGQGNEILSSNVLDVPIEGRGPLKVMVLDMLYQTRTPDGRNLKSSSYYAYWFVGKNRETPYHLERMFWMGADRILHNTSHRWAYIAVAGNRPEESTRHREQIAGFVSRLYPHMALN
jgi:hypothetical protein